MTECRRGGLLRLHSMEDRRAWGGTQMRILKIVPCVRPAVMLPAVVLLFSLIWGFNAQALAADDSAEIQNVIIEEADIISQWGTEGESSITLSGEYTADLTLGTLTMPGAYIQAYVTVKNENDFAVEIAEISQDTDLPADLYFEVTTPEEDQDTIEAGSSAVFAVTVGWDPDSSANLEYQEYGFQIILTYEEDSVSLAVQTGADDGGTSAASAGTQGDTGDDADDTADAGLTTGTGDVKAGDSSTVLLWMLLIICCAAVLLGIAEGRRRKNGSEK